MSFGYRDSFRIEKEKFYPGPRLELGSPAFRAGALTTETINDEYRSMTEFSSYNYPFWPQDRQSVPYCVLIEVMHSKTLESSLMKGVLMLGPRTT